MQGIEQKFEIEEILLSEIATRAKSLHKTESALVNELLRKALREDSRKKKLSEEEVGKMYAEAYGKHPVQPDEFEIADEQMAEFWEQI